MATNFLFTVKFLTCWIYTFALSPVAKMSLSVSPKQPPDAIFYIFFSMMWLPELAIFSSSGFRQWIKSGIENADGKLNSRDVKDMMLHYVSLNCMRLFVLMSLLMMFYDFHIEFKFYMIPFIGSLGLSGLTIFKNLYRVK